MADHSGASGGRNRGQKLASAAAASARRIASSTREIVGSGLLGAVVVALGIGAAGLLVAAEVSPVVTIEILTGGSCEILADPDLRDACSQTGGERHSWALAVLGLLALVMAWGAGVGRSRAAAAALAAAGAAVLAIVLIGDLPEVNETGEIGLRFDEAEAETGSGFYLSIAGGLAALAGGVIGLVRRE